MDGGKFVLAAFVSCADATTPKCTVTSSANRAERIEGERNGCVTSSVAFQLCIPCRPLLNIPTNTCQAQQLFRLPFLMNQRASVGYDAAMLLSVDQT